MNILYVTTFNRKLYDQSGNDLINSFLDKNIDGDLLVCYEEIDFMCNSKNILKSSFLY